MPKKKKKKSLQSAQPSVVASENVTADHVAPPENSADVAVAPSSLETEDTQQTREIQDADIDTLELSHIGSMCTETGVNAVSPSPQTIGHRDEDNSPYHESVSCNSETDKSSETDRVVQTTDSDPESEHHDLDSTEVLESRNSSDNIHHLSLENTCSKHDDHIQDMNKGDTDFNST